MTGMIARVLLLIAFCVLVSASNVYAQTDFVYIRNDSTISAFSVDASGSMQRVSGSPFPAGGFDSSFLGFFGANRIIINRDFLYTSNGSSGSIGVFSIDSTTGRLTPVSGSPFFLVGLSFRGISLGVTPDNRFLYAVNLDFGTIRVYSIGSDGALTNIESFFTVIGTTPDGIKVSPDGRFLAVTLPFNHAVAMYSIQADGSLVPVPGSPFTTSGLMSGPASVDINCASNLLFVGQACTAALCATPTTVDVFSIASNGALTPISGSPFTPGVGADANVVSLSRDDRKLFVTNQGSHTVTVFDVAADGSLTLVPGSPFQDEGFALQPAGVATNRAETLLFTTNFHGPLSIFNLAPDGSLTTISGSPFPTDGGTQVLSLAAYPAKTCESVPSFDICIQDDSEGDTLKINSDTGEYELINCSGFTIGGTGELIRRGSTITLVHNATDRRVSAKIDTSVNKGTATIQVFSQARTFTISDRNLANSTCGCSAR